MQTQQGIEAEHGDNTLKINTIPYNIRNCVNLRVLSFYHKDIKLNNLIMIQSFIQNIFRPSRKKECFTAFLTLNKATAARGHDRCNIVNTFCLLHFDFTGPLLDNDLSLTAS